MNLETIFFGYQLHRHYASIKVSKEEMDRYRVPTVDGLFRLNYARNLLADKIDPGDAFTASLQHKTVFGSRLRPRQWGPYLNDLLFGSWSTRIAGQECVWDFKKRKWLDDMDLAGPRRSGPAGEPARLGQCGDQGTGGKPRGRQDGRCDLQARPLRMNQYLIVRKHRKKKCDWCLTRQQVWSVLDWHLCGNCIGLMATAAFADRAFACEQPRMPKR
jgi:hypothetical protein